MTKTATTFRFSDETFDILNANKAVGLTATGVIEAALVWYMGKLKGLIENPDSSQLISHYYQMRSAAERMMQAKVPVRQWDEEIETVLHYAFVLAMANSEDKTYVKEVGTSMLQRLCERLQVLESQLRDGEFDDL